MAEEPQQNTEGGETSQEPNTVPKSDLDALRSKYESKIAAANKRAQTAESNFANMQTQIVPPELDVKLPEADAEGDFKPEVKSKLETALKTGIEARQNLGLALNLAMDMSAKAGSYELALELDAVDDRDDIEARLQEAENLNELEQLKREIRLEYKEANLNKKATTSKETPSSSERVFDEGGGRAVSGTNNLVRKIAEAKTQDELDAVYADVLRVKPR